LFSQRCVKVVVSCAASLTLANIDDAGTSVARKRSLRHAVVVRRPPWMAARTPG